MTDDQLKQFIHKRTLTVISTFGDDYPESAVIEYGDSGFELIFDTKSATRKYANLVRNPKASFVIGWEDRETVRYEGEAVLLEGSELEQYKQIYFSKIPDAKKWQHEKSIVYFKVTPRWIRYSDLSTTPWTIKELRF